MTCQVSNHSIKEEVVQIRNKLNEFEQGCHNYNKVYPTNRYTIQRLYVIVLIGKKQLEVNKPQIGDGAGAGQTEILSSNMKSVATFEET